MNRSTALGALGVVAATALVGGATVPSAAAAPATCFGKRATITGHGLVVGTEGPDVIVTSRRSTVRGRGGDDRICGAYTMHGGAGNDRIHFGRTFDTDFMEVTGGEGRDRIVVSSHADVVIVTGAGADAVETGSGWQYVDAGAGLDSVTTGRGDDEIHGGAGADVLDGRQGRDEITGDGGDDLLRGGDGADRLFDGYERDLGDDTARGGPGVDACADSLERRISCERG